MESQTSNTKLIPLTQGRFAIVDAEDYEWLSKWKWSYGYGGYAGRGIQYGVIYMHRLILGTPAGSHTDHINGNGLDNRKSNLRICTHHENMRNRSKQKGSSKYKGVYWERKREKWIAQIKINNKNIHLGSFKKEYDASVAYDLAAIKYHGIFAKVNCRG